VLIEGGEADSSIKGDLVVEVNGPATEVVVGVGGGYELLELEQIVQTDDVAGECGLQAQAFAGLEEGLLASEAGGSGLGEDLLDVRGGGGVAGANGGKRPFSSARMPKPSLEVNGMVARAPVMFSVKPKAERAEGGVSGPRPQK